MDQNFSIILPTFREAKNIPELIYRIAKIDFGNKVYEAIIVDDNSHDGTAEMTLELAKHYPWLKLIVRQGKKGLSEAVMEGLAQAKYPLCVVMDADLSHPPEKIPDILAALSHQAVDFVIGSRYVAGGSCDEQWPIARQFVSHLAVFLARRLIAVPVKDPLSGFLAFRKQTYLSGNIAPIGWKIGLEIMVKCHCTRILEIPIHFSRRVNGYSKLTLKTVFDYIKHIGSLAWFKLTS